MLVSLQVGVRDNPLWRPLSLAPNTQHLDKIHMTFCGSHSKLWLMLSPGKCLGSFIVTNLNPTDITTEDRINIQNLIPIDFFRVRTLKKLNGEKKKGKSAASKRDQTVDAGNATSRYALNEEIFIVLIKIYPLSLVSTFHCSSSTCFCYRQKKQEIKTFSAPMQDRTTDLQFTRLTLYHWAIGALTIGRQNYNYFTNNLRTSKWASQLGY